jgi:uncharacterized tellurite resistance protein B-like protein
MTMAENIGKPRFEGDSLIIETRGAEEVYDAKYLVASLLVLVAKGDHNISGPETAEMIELVSEHFSLPTSASLELLTNAMEDIAENPDFENLLRDLSRLLSTEEKEEVALMMLKVIAANGRKNAEEMDQLRVAADIVGIPPEVLHRAFDRYFEETMS